MKKHKRIKLNAQNLGHRSTKDALKWLQEKEGEDAWMHALYGECQYDMCSGIRTTYAALYEMR